MVHTNKYVKKGYNFVVKFQVFTTTHKSHDPYKLIYNYNYKVSKLIINPQNPNTSFQKIKNFKAISYQTSRKVGKHIAIKHYLHGWIYNQNVNCLLRHLINKFCNNPL